MESKVNRLTDESQLKLQETIQTDADKTASNLFQIITKLLQRIIKLQQPITHLSISCFVGQLQMLQKKSHWPVLLYHQTAIVSLYWKMQGKRSRFLFRNNITSRIFGHLPDNLIRFTSMCPDIQICIYIGNPQFIIFEIQLDALFLF